MDQLIDRFSEKKTNLLDGLKIDENNYWVHLRKSNTEPIIRIIAEAKSKKEAEEIVTEYTEIIKSL
jgi:phosphomannomutase